jgi:hypothetical protein
LDKNIILFSTLEISDILLKSNAFVIFYHSVTQGGIAYLKAGLSFDNKVIIATVPLQ